MRAPHFRASARSPACGRATRYSRRREHEDCRARDAARGRRPPAADPILPRRRDTGNPPAESSAPASARSARVRRRTPGLRQARQRATLLAKRVPDPLHLPCGAVDEKHVEAAVRVPTSGQVEARRGKQAGALRQRHAFGSAAVVAALAHADFGKHQRAALLGDEIDLSKPAAPVSLEQPQACCPQQACTKILGSRPSPVHGRLNETARAPVDRMTPGSLHVVATPIGNLGDASPRAIEALRAADLIACEDTRTSRTLLARHAISARTVALHEHNERATAAKLLEAMRAGKNVALISDAGTPALSDPGALLVEQAHRAGI